MSQMGNIIKAWKRQIADDPTVTALIPGGVHHGKRLDKDADRPYAIITVEELTREYNSGLMSIADYDVTFTVYGDDYVGTSGNTQESVAELFDLALTVGKLDTPEQQLLLVTPKAGSLEEDEDTIEGKDVILSSNKWKVKIQES